MLTKINIYIVTQIFKSFVLVFFIFLSITWLLQITRLLTLTNLIQIDILNICLLSLLLIPNLITIIFPFILIFSIILCFIKLNKDKEIIAIVSLGLKLDPIKNSLVIFGIILSIVYSILNLYIAPKVYKIYKFNEFELRNTINFNKMNISNFLKLNENTFNNFNKNENVFENIFINFNDKSQNLIFSNYGEMKKNDQNYIFQLRDGFKISINNDKIEKLEFKNYELKIIQNNNVEFNEYNINAFTILDNLEQKNYLFILFKLIDIFFIIIALFIFYKNIVVKFHFDNFNNFLYLSFTIIFLISNEVFKNLEVNIFIYSLFIILAVLLLLNYSKFLKINE